MDRRGATEQGAKDVWRKDGKGSPSNHPLEQPLKKVAFRAGVEVHETSLWDEGDLLANVLDVRGSHADELTAVPQLSAELSTAARHAALEPWPLECRLPSWSA